VRIVLIANWSIDPAGVFAFWDSSGIGVLASFGPDSKRLAPPRQRDRLPWKPAGPVSLGGRTAGVNAPKTRPPRSIAAPSFVQARGLPAALHAAACQQSLGGRKIQVRRVARPMELGENNPLTTIARELHP
jgi:hypothetical protein